MSKEVQSMTMRNKKGYHTFISLSVLLTLFLLIGQSAALIDYDLLVYYGLQESKLEIGDVGIAFAKGFAFSDTVLYIPLLIIGIIGLQKDQLWGVLALFGSSAISIYWPLVHLHAIFINKKSFDLNPDKYLSFSIVLPIIVLYGIFGMWFTYRILKEHYTPS